MKKSNSNQLKKALGFGFGIAILVGSTIGVGILRTPGTIASLLDNYWLIIACWLIGGAYVLIGVGSYAELATMLPKAGGSYNYVKRAFGNYAGFVTGWFDYITNAIAPAFFCIVIGEYMVILFPIFKSQSTIIAISFLLAFTILHATGVKSGSVVQQIISVVKVLLFTSFIIACFMYIGVKITPLEKNNSLLEMGVIVAFFKSLQMVIGSYNGWNAGCFFAEEDTNPTKNIPKSLYNGAFIVIIIYVVINMAFLHVVPVSTLANAPLAAAEVAKVVFGEAGAIIITVIALFSVIGILNAFMMIPARILYGMSRDGFFIKKGTQINNGGTPIFALLTTSLLVLALIIIGTFDALFSLASFMSIIVWGLAYASLMKLRLREPHLLRPYKSWGYPFTTILMLLFSVALFAGFAYSDTSSFVNIIIIIALSYPLFLIIKSNNK